LGEDDMTQSENFVADLAAGLRVAGVRKGGSLLVHSSLRSLGRVAGGAETVIKGLLAALGDEGTLLMPGLTYERVTSANPTFSVLGTPSNVGLIPEYFRLRPGTRRSVHPTHSVCATGPLADAFLAEHLEDSTPVGPHSPFRKLRDNGGQILMLGCGLRPNTSMHGVEELVEPPYLYADPLLYRLILADGQVIEKTYRRHGFRGWTQRYDRVADVLHEPHLRKGRVLAATVHVIEAAALWEAAEAALRRNPLYFIDQAE
jgi:aminoglycoside 3-N-acetyltransferase